MSDNTTDLPDTEMVAGMVEIERLRRKNHRLREALQNIADVEGPGALPGINILAREARLALTDKVDSGNVVNGSISITLREYYAGLAMQGILAAQIHGFNDAPKNGPFSYMAVGMADALMAALQEDGDE